MKIVVTGSGGQLGTRLMQMGEDGDHRVIGLDLPEFDLGRFADIADPILEIKPDVIVHTAAYTDVDASEKNIQLAEDVNWFGTRALAAVACKLDALFIYISTDYVFDGLASKPYVETDVPNPSGRYAATKHLGEEEVRRLCPHHAILRTCGLYGPTGKNFVKSILRVLHEKGSAKVVDDQVVSPTYDKDLAGAIQAVIESGAMGTYHAANVGPLSWFEFARKIAELAGYGSDAVTAIKTEELNLAAPRPKFSALDSSALAEATGYVFRPWDQALTDFLTNDSPKENMKKVIGNF